MSNSSNKSGRSSFFGDGLSADSVQKEFIEAPAAAARQPAITTGLDLLAFMSALPGAFLASEQHELQRLARTSADKNDPRVERLKASIERTAELHATSLQGKARIDRAIVALSTEDNVFHGFVSDTNLKPREKVTVRISALRDGEKKVKSLSSITDADGYFSISLGKEKTDIPKPGSNESAVKLSEQMAARLASVNAKAKADTSTASNERGAAAANTNEVLARVEILDVKKNIIHQDQSALVVNAGTAYREYVIENKDSGHDRPRYAGNPATRELHDTQQLTTRCNFDAIAPNVRVYFDSPAAAEKAGYDYCAYCFDKAKSKR
jgi:hypothetical protein